MTTNRKSFENQNKAPSLFWLLTEPSRAAMTFGAYYLANKRIINALPKGDGHPVLVLPGFIANDTTTIPIRGFLDDCGYQSYAWDMGVNLGKSFYLDILYEKVEKIYKETRQKVSIIGWSLGGVYAREIARKIPECVRQVITMGTPFMGLFEPSNAKWLHQFLHGKSYGDLPEGFLDRVLITPPVPTTAIYTKEDGIVNWKHCIETQETAIVQNIQVLGGHCGLGHNPSVLYCVGDRLSQKEDTWSAFQPKGAWSLFYPNIQRTTKAS